MLCYAPTELATSEEKENFYQQLQALLNRIPSSDMVLLLGDMNAKVGHSLPGDGPVTGQHGLGVRNDNGSRFVNCCQLNGLTIGGTIFPHKSIHKGTWRSPDGTTVNQIDHVCISQRHRKCLVDVRSMRGADLGLTDHYLVRAKIRVKLKKQSRPSVIKVLDSNKLENDQVNVEFREEFQRRLGQDETTDDVNCSWRKFKDAVNESAVNVLGYKSGRREEWISDGTWDLIQEKKNLKMKMETSSSQTREVFRNLHRAKAAEVKRASRRDRRRFLNGKADEAEQAANRNDQRTLFKMSKELGGTKKGYNGVIKDANGNKISSEREKVERWKEHFSRVLNCDEPTSPHVFENQSRELQVELGPIREEEVVEALSNQKSNKSPGEDLISAEMLKALGNLGIAKLTLIYNQIWQAESAPIDWKNSIIVKVPKKGDLSNCNNWRGISLLSVPGKVLCSVIYNRLKESCELALREEQAGFRAGRGCSDQIFVLRNIIEQCEEFRKPLVMNFVDFKKAFDSIHRPSMWKILKWYGFPEKIISIIKDMYEGSKCSVRVGQEHTDWFSVATGVRQGDVLSPLLFNLVLDFIMRKLDTSEGGLTWVGSEKLKDLDYADDICLLAENFEEMQQLTDQLASDAAKIGLKINCNKSEIMKKFQPVSVPISVDGVNLKEVEQFTYLGCNITNDGDIRNEINIRIGKAGAAFRNMSKVWSNRIISLRTKIRLYDSIVTSILLYGSESWKGLKEIEERVRIFESGCLRRIMNVRWYEHVSENEIRRRSGLRSIIERIKENRWKWYGHVLRMPESRLPKQTTQWNPVGSRRRGRPKDTWRRTMQRELRMHNLREEDVPSLAEDRSAWRRLVADLWTS